MSVEEIELSMMSYVAPDQLADLLRDFEAQHRVHVRLQRWEWETSWSEIMKVALYGHGPVVSEIGSTWAASLAVMNVLRPFNGMEVAAMGKAAAFLPAAWNSGLMPGDPNPAAIPWLSETRAIYYRRDLFQQAGLADITRFESNAHLEDTLKTLQGHGLSAWTMPTRATLNTFHNMTSWVWGAGGDFVDAAQRQVTFAEPAARAGIAAYFGLHRFLAPDARRLTVEESEARFLQGQTAMTISGPWLYLSPELPRTQQVAETTGVAMLPGVPWVGASHLVVWKHAAPRQVRLAVELVRFLTSMTAQVASSTHTGMLPVLPEALNAPAFVNHPVYQVVGRGLLHGRSFPAMRLWGLIEEKLTAALGSLWAKVLTAEPGASLDALIRAELEPLAARLNKTLLT
jgi:multiple sugar transport system substrate-binding protein